MKKINMAKKTTMKEIEKMKRKIKIKTRREKYAEDETNEEQRK